MKSCGVIVEYNPYHYGHAYHVQQAKKVSQADVMIAVMSGNFLQRGEPAIIDKFHRAKAALSSGVDLVLELPYAHAVQHSDYFAKGAIEVLQEVGVSSICFGSESGNINYFKTGYERFIKNQDTYEKEIKSRLNDGLSFPDASMHAYRAIGLTNVDLDLSKPNNILGLGYVKVILDRNHPIDMYTIKRIHNDFHEEQISGSIASATSIREEMIHHNHLTTKVLQTIPEETKNQLEKYKREATIWHDWEKYFQLVHYRVQTMTTEELRNIHGMVEGLEYRLKQTANRAEGMNDWIESVKSKRYTWTRIQRLFTHLLTNSTQHEIESFFALDKLPYVRVLGMNIKGQAYLNQIKKQVDVPIVHQFSRNMHPLLEREEKASSAYYSILPPKARKKFMLQELNGPIRIEK